MSILRFEPDGLEIEVPEGTSILEGARLCHAHMGSACGGVCACSTCHVYVKEGRNSLSPVEDKEEDIIDKAFDVRVDSRLGCQAKVAGSTRYVIEISRESRQSFFDEHPELRPKI